MHNDTILFFRKKREIGNFSIERSFAETQKAFESLGLTPPVWHTMKQYSSGIIPRIQMLIEAYKKRGLVNHVTGDINFLALGLPGNNTILTILDCGFLDHPNPVMRKVIKWFWLDLPVRHAAYITAISESTKQDIIHYTGCNPEKITVIPVVIPCEFENSPRTFNSTNPRILHIGTAANKNLRRHAEALAGIDCCLHVIGKLSDNDKKALEKFKINYINEYELPNNKVRDAYDNCDLLLFASTIEGFGMPILEAQSMGRPVVTSNISSMPEVSGRGACLVDPYDVKSIRNGILMLIQNAPYRESLISYGLENVKRYQPLHIANQYANLYNTVRIENQK